MCAVLLLPISILSNEVLLSFPQSYYMQWLNGSLIHGTSYVLWIYFCFNELLIASSQSMCSRDVCSQVISVDRLGLTLLCARLHEIFFEWICLL